MSIVVQKGFWQDTYLADTRRKVTELYFKNPDVAQSEKRIILEFRSSYEHLASLMGDKWHPFVDWFLTATSPETITRCLRALKEDGTITISSDGRKRSKERKQEWR